MRLSDALIIAIALTLTGHSVFSLLNAIFLSVMLFMLRDLMWKTALHLNLSLSDSLDVGYPGVGGQGGSLRTANDRSKSLETSLRIFGKRSPRSPSSKDGVTGLVQKTGTHERSNLYKMDSSTGKPNATHQQVAPARLKSSNLAKSNSSTYRLATCSYSDRAKDTFSGVRSASGIQAASGCMVSLCVEGTIKQIGH